MVARRYVKRRVPRRRMMAGPIVAQGARYVLPRMARMSARRAVALGAIGGGAAVTAGTLAAFRQENKRRQATFRRVDAGSQPTPVYRSRTNKSTQTGGVRTFGGSGDVNPPVRVVANLKAGGYRIPSKILRTLYVRRILRWQNCSVLNSGATIPGAITLPHQTVFTDKTLTPCCMFLLNNTNNNTVVTAGPAYRVVINNTGGLEMLQLNGQGPTGSAVAKWVTDYSTETVTDDPDTRYIMNDYYDIRLNCYGANSQPTTYHIQVVSFSDAHLDPLETPSNAQEASDRHKTFQAIVQPMMSNPIMPRSYVRPKMKVHCSASFTLQSTLNVENDTTPQSRIVRMFVRDGSFYDYAYHGDGFKDPGADDQLSTTQYVPQNISGVTDYWDNPMPRARKWLIVKALNTTRTSAETASNTPSFDIVIRKNEYHIGKV